MRLYNSLTRSKEEFQPLDGKKVKLYVCGITPNNATHLGHAFTYVSFDVLVRYLQYKGFGIEYLQNATDVNDSEDVIKQAWQTGKSWDEIADYWISHFRTQLKSLNILLPTYYKKASSAIEKIIEINKKLIDKGFAYEKNGSVYFDISKFKEYGKLSKFNYKQMLLISKERGNNPNDPNKKNPLDFLLWLKSKEIPNWKSPWGSGRPGWHIECSALIYKHLGDQIDIHGGGRDLIFPHHESEIAQMESFTGQMPFVKFWMHVGMVLYEGEKMSKSLGNLVLVEDLLKKYSPNAIRWLLLSHYWRQPWEFMEDELEEAEKKISVITKILNNQKARKKSYEREPIKVFEKMMDDDLYTPRVLEWLYAKVERKEDLSEIKNILRILGFNFSK